MKDLKLTAPELHLVHQLFLMTMVLFGHYNTHCMLPVETSCCNILVCKVMLFTGKICYADLDIDLTLILQKSYVINFEMFSTLYVFISIIWKVRQATGINSNKTQEICIWDRVLLCSWAVPEHATRLPSNMWQSSCLCFLSAGITGVWD